MVNILLLIAGNLLCAGVGYFLGFREADKDSTHALLGTQPVAIRPQVERRIALVMTNHPRPEILGTLKATMLASKYYYVDLDEGGSVRWEQISEAWRWHYAD